MAKQAEQIVATINVTKIVFYGRISQENLSKVFKAYSESEKGMVFMPEPIPESFTANVYAKFADPDAKQNFVSKVQDLILEVYL